MLAFPAALMRCSRAISSAGVICGIDTIGFAIARPDAAIAPARPVFLRFGDLLEPCEPPDGRLGEVGSFSFIESRRNMRFFFVVLLTEYTEAASELSCAERRPFCAKLGNVALALSVLRTSGFVGLIRVGDSTMGDIATPSSPSRMLGGGGDVVGRWFGVPGRDWPFSLLSLLSFRRRPLRLDLVDLFDFNDGVRRSSCTCWRSKPPTVAERGCW